jgi:PKD repeat protein
MVIGLILVFVLTSSIACSASQNAENDSARGTLGGMAAPMTTTASMSSPTYTFSADYSSVSTGNQLSFDRMVVRTGSMQLVVSDVAGSMDQVARIAEDNGGYVVSSQKSKNGDRTIGNISIRIIATNYDKTITALRALALDVVNESSVSQDVTQEYVDLGSTLKNLQATDAQLLKIMETATKTQDVLDVQRQLTDVEGQIEQTKGRMQYLERTSATSLINVELDQAAVSLKISADKTSVGTNEKIHFLADVSGGTAPYNYEWNFGDGATSNSKTPDYSYSTAGTYSISLKVTDDKGYSNEETRSGYINVEGGWNVNGVARDAWSGFSTFGRGLINLIIWLGIFSPIWVVILIILWFTVWRRKKKI